MVNPWTGMGKKHRLRCAHSLKVFSLGHLSLCGLTYCSSMAGSKAGPVQPLVPNIFRLWALLGSIYLITESSVSTALILPVFLFFPAILRYNWLLIFYKFKVYNQSVWYTSITAKWLPPWQLHLVTQLPFPFYGENIWDLLTNLQVHNTVLFVSYNHHAVH